MKKDTEQFPGTPMEGPQEDVTKDGGGFSAPASATSGINNYDLEGSRVKKPKTKKSKARWNDNVNEGPAATGGATKAKPRGPERRPTKPSRPMHKDEDECMDKDEGENAPYDDFDDKDDTSTKTKKVDITKFEMPELEKFYAANKPFFDSEELVKGVCDVASLGNLIAQLSFMADSQAYERQIEGDTSKIPEELRTESAKLLGILSDMASEESEEITSGTTAEDVMRTTQPTMSPGLYRSDVGEFAKALRESLGLAKVGARNSAKDLETIQKVHDAACELGANCGSQSSEGDVSKLNGESDMRKTDTIMAEGNKRGAAVSDPTPGKNSLNAADAEITSDQGQETPVSDAKKSKKRMDEDMARKGKKRADMDMDDDEMDDEMDDDMDDDEDDDLPAPKKKAAKAKKYDSDDIAKAVAAGVKAALSSIGDMQKSSGAQEVNIRNAPHLMAVGKDGGLSKHVAIDVDALKKSVQVHPKDLNPETARAGDNGTTTLIKAIHAAGSKFLLSPSDIPTQN